MKKMTFCHSVFFFGAKSNSPVTTWIFFFFIHSPHWVFWTVTLENAFNIVTFWGFRKILFRYIKSLYLLEMYFEIFVDKKIYLGFAVK
jgi:hypothetical protein